MKLTLILLSLLLAPVGWSLPNEAVVIEVRKKLKLHNSEVIYNDYFINGGSKLGLDKGTIVSVVRRVPVHDPFQNASIGDFRVKVAEVEIIQADPDKAIARLVEIDRTADRPMVRYDSIMVGDRLDLATIHQKVAVVEPFLMPTPMPTVEENTEAQRDVSSLPAKTEELPKKEVEKPAVPLTKP